jgi:hypothetical protein
MTFLAASAGASSRSSSPGPQNFAYLLDARKRQLEQG